MPLFDVVYIARKTGRVHTIDRDDAWVAAQTNVDTDEVNLECDNLVWEVESVEVAYEEDDE